MRRRTCHSLTAATLLALTASHVSATFVPLPPLNGTSNALATELALKTGDVPTLDAGLARFTGSVACYMDDAGDVVGLQFGNDPPLCTDVGAVRRFDVPSDGYIASLAVAVNPVTQLIGQIVFTVKSDGSLLPTNIVSCGTQGLKIPVDIMPQPSALVSVSGACRAAAPTGRRLSQQTGLDPASLRVQVTSVDAGALLSTPRVLQPTTPPQPPPKPPALVLYTLQYSRGAPQVNKLYRCPVDTGTATATCTSVTLTNIPPLGAVSIGRIAGSTAYITSATNDSGGYFACDVATGACSALVPWNYAPTFTYASPSLYDGSTWFIREATDPDGIFYACQPSSCIQLLWTFPGGTTYPTLQGFSESSDPDQIYVLANKFPPNPHGLFMCPKQGGPCNATTYDADSLVANGQQGLWVDNVTGTAYVADEALANKLWACPASGAPCGYVTVIGGPVSNFAAQTLALGAYGRYE